MHVNLADTVGGGKIGDYWYYTYDSRTVVY
jgi:hypothetical protein